MLPGTQLKLQRARSIELLNDVRRKPHHIEEYTKNQQAATWFNEIAGISWKFKATKEHPTKNVETNLYGIVAC